jgi:acetolactate decarboxylase
MSRKEMMTYFSNCLSGNFANRTVGLTLILLLCCFIAEAQAQTSKVRWAGSMHQAMQQGNLSAHASLDSLLKKPHLYALGPLEGLQGEVMVTDGTALVARIQDGKPVSSKTQQAKTAFLVYAYVPDWQEITIPALVTDLTSLEKFIGDVAPKSGISADAPFAFRLTGKPQEMVVHVVNLPTDMPPGTEIKDAHDESLVRSTIKGQEVEVIGFYSIKHAGIFTPHSTRLHSHARLSDNSHSGHLESITLQPGMKLYLPK